MARKGDTWNESEIYRDALTLREVRRVTTAGLYNQTPTYHTNVAFSADGEWLVFASSRDGRSAVFRCHVPTGEITQLIDPLVGVGAEGLGIGGGASAWRRGASGWSSWRARRCARCRSRRWRSGR